MFDTLVFESLNATLLAYSQIKTQYFLFRDHRAARVGKKTAGDLLTAIARGWEQGKGETDFSLLSLAWLALG